MTESLRVAVLGAQGRMGRLSAETIEAAPDLQLVAALDRGDELAQLAGLVDVAVDFTSPEATVQNVLELAGLGIHCVVGTTGWTDESLGLVRDAVDGTGVAVLIAPNFALGAVLAMAFAERAAQYFESVEVVELHHPDKIDAPSGTARHTAERIGRARRDAGLPSVPDATTIALDGARGAVVDGVHVHAVRLRGLVAHQEVLFGGPGEQLTLRHDSYDRVSFMPGVLLAVRAVPTRPGLTVGLEHILEL